jgi:hypothetical protein
VAAKKAAALLACRRSLGNMRCDMSSFSQAVKAVLSAAADEFVTFKSELTSALTAVQADAKQANERYVSEAKERRRLHNVVAELKGNIRVFCRIRPASRDELSAGDKIGITPVVTFRVSDVALALLMSHNIRTLMYRTTRNCS